MDKKEKFLNKKAVALKYGKEDRAPKVLAKGKGEAASKILEIGKEKDIVVYEDENLIDDLLKLELSEEIPPELYEAVSEVILFVYSLDRKKGEKYGR